MFEQVSCLLWSYIIILYSCIFFFFKFFSSTSKYLQSWPSLAWESPLTFFYVYVIGSPLQMPSVCVLQKLQRDILQKKQQQPPWQEDLDIESTGAAVGEVEECLTE